MNIYLKASLASASLLTSISSAGEVLIVSAGSPATDAALVTALSNQGHTATIGPNYWEFDTSVDLSPYDVLYIQGNGNWTQSDMPVDAQSMILEFTEDGGGIIFSEWVVWMVAARDVFQVLAAAMPVEETTVFRTTSEITFTLNTPEPFLTDNLPNSMQQSSMTRIGTSLARSAAQPSAGISVADESSTFLRRSAQIKSMTQTSRFSSVIWSHGSRDRPPTTPAPSITSRHAAFSTSSTSLSFLPDSQHSIPVQISTVTGYTTFLI